MVCDEVTFFMNFKNKMLKSKLEALSRNVVFFNTYLSTYIITSSLIHKVTTLMKENL
jgi:hypothetical protein